MEKKLQWILGSFLVQASNDVKYDLPVMNDEIRPGF